MSRGIDRELLFFEKNLNLGDVVVRVALDQQYHRCNESLIEDASLLLLELPALGSGHLFLDKLNAFVSRRALLCAISIQFIARI